MDIERSLILNGNFVEPGMKYWELHGDGSRYSQENDEERNYVYLYYGIVKQHFSLPVDPYKSTYRLHLEYQPSQNSSEPVVQPYLELWAFPTARFKPKPLVGPSRESTKTMPWLEDQVDFSPFKEGDNKFELRVASGLNPETSPDPGSPPEEESPKGEWPWRPGALHFTAVEVKLHLQPLKLSDTPIKLGNQDARFLPNGKVPICRGATHLLAPVVDTECGWAPEQGYPGTLVYAEWADKDAASTLEVELSMTDPKEDGTQQMGKAYNVISGNLGSGNLDITFQSIYNADPFTLPCTVGHFKLEQVEHQQPEYWPVFPKDETIDLAVCLHNAVTTGPAEGVVVSWAKPDGSSEDVLTDQQGWARYQYQPIKGEDHTVTANFDAPYNKTAEQHAFNVRMIPTQPWGQFVLLFDGKPMDMDKDFLPITLGKVFQLQLKPSAECVLIDQLVGLEWAIDGGGDPEEVKATPPLGGERARLTAEGFTWVIECHTYYKYRIAIRVSCDQFKVPLEFAMMLLGIGNMKIASPEESQEALEDADKIFENKLLYISDPEKPEDTVDRALY
ncbi:hypothetical protein [Pseudomonas putida]|uniref:hypothetical protein n=1 Tax=Pseudomonas putida TaxID=303 RepID=UPI0023672016|nr:hypothetical protein [Pseudomonas putida]MDD2047767.1 hypothetical protein [Pseudomonas putida]